MFSQLRRVPLRRCLHSQVPHTSPKTNTQSSRLAFTLAATVISYSTWRWTTDQRIALDSVTVTECTCFQDFSVPLFTKDTYYSHQISRSRRSLFGDSSYFLHHSHNFCSSFSLRQPKFLRPYSLYKNRTRIIFNIQNRTQI